MSVASASAPPPPSPSTVIDSNTFGQSQAINADVLSAVELEQFKEYIEAIKAAYHRALTRQSLKKYDYEHRYAK
jgi:hypothetical protein